jgi:hypothetical protein
MAYSVTALLYSDIFLEQLLKNTKEESRKRVNIDDSQRECTYITTVPKPLNSKMTGVSCSRI